MIKNIFKTAIMALGLTVLLIQCDNSGKKKHTATQELELILDSLKESPGLFTKLETYSNKDLEIGYVFNTKNKLDSTLIKLVYLHNNSMLSSNELSERSVFTKQIVQMLGMGNSIQDATNSFKAHMEYIQIFTSTEHDNMYDKAKKGIMLTDDKMVRYSQLLIPEMTKYQLEQMAFSQVLTGVLADVSNNDLKSAADKLKSKEVDSYYISTAKLMKALYEFEIYRAESIIEACDTYMVK